MPSPERPSGPPQEGLDPKLKILTDLAPAEGDGVSGADHTAITPIVTDNAAMDTMSDAQRPREQPPQVGQDPKLAACVNDGEIVHESTDVEDVAIKSEVNGAEDAPSDVVPGTIETIEVGTQQAVEKEDGEPGETGIAAPPPTAKTADVAAKILSIEQALYPQPPETNTEKPEEIVQGNDEQGAEEAPPPSSSNATSSPNSNTGTAANTPHANSNPNLTSSESLAEWNRIHASSGPSYDFFKKSQDAKKMTASSGKDIKIEDLIESSKARSAASNIKPLFTLNADGAATVAPSTENDMPTAQAEAAMNNPHQGPPANSNQHPVAPNNQPGVPPSGTPDPENESNKKNSNFWLQEEEERFLLGLRLYGWGQWKRIQTIVQTRSNKQIKSHAQKREKVNPEIKAKYGKGKSRRGRISSKVLADDARAMAIAGGSVGEVANALLGNDESIPSLDQAWKDVYGTNNGDGPNSRSRRYRQQHYQQRYVAEASLAIGSQQEQPQQQQQQHQPAYLEHGKEPAAKKNSEHPSLQSLQESYSNPLYKQPMNTTMDRYNQHMDASRMAVAGTPMADHAQRTADYHDANQAGQPEHAAHYPVAPPPALPHPPPPAYEAPIHHPRQSPVPAAQHFQPAPWQHHQQPSYSSTAVPIPQQTAPPALLATTHAVPAMENGAGITTAKATNVVNESTSKKTDTTSLRPGMRIYSRIKPYDERKTLWSPGTIYSAKVDPTKLSEESVPLIYHIQYDNGSEDPNVPEDLVMSKSFYEVALHDLERCHTLPRPTDFKSEYHHPLDMGVPVYCQWMDMYVPEMHGRWMPGTIHSYQQLQDGMYSYHILFDNEQEKQHIPQEYILDRTEYHDLVELKYQTPEDKSMRPVGELYNLFLGKDDDSSHNDNVNSGIKGQQPATPPPQPPIQAHSEVAGQRNVNADYDKHGEPEQQSGQLDLLFTASQMKQQQQQITTTATTEKRARDDILDVQDGSNKRQQMDTMGIHMV